MNRGQRSIHDQLHALADGQLDTEQSRHILSLLEKDQALQKEMCDIQRIKHLVQSAYPLPAEARQGLAKTAGARPAIQRAAAYLLAFSLTYLAGFGSHYLPDLWQPEGTVLNGATAQDNRFIIFLDSHDPAKLEKTLFKAETLAHTVQASGGGVYVVTSAEGIDLLRLGTTQHEQRLTRLNQMYPSLRFVACSSTLYSFRQQGELVALVDGVEIAPSAVEFVVKHMQQGWRYIAI